MFSAEYDAGLDAGLVMDGNLSSGIADMLFAVKTA
jgi:hypothetical protein